MHGAFTFFSILERTGVRNIDARRARCTAINSFIPHHQPKGEQAAKKRLESLVEAEAAGIQMETA
jgi:hypothetical protein